MKNIKIVGLPVVVSHCYRIILDKSIRTLYQIRNDDLIRMCETDGFFANRQVCLPDRNGYRNPHLPGKFGTGLHWRDTAMNILGCPLKLSSQNAIYFPLNYMRVYNIDPYLDVMIREQSEHYFIYRPYVKRELLPAEKVIHVRACVTYLPPEWIATNELIPGKDSLYLIGTDDGFVVSASEKIQL